MRSVFRAIGCVAGFSVVFAGTLLWAAGPARAFSVRTIAPRRAVNRVVTTPSRSGASPYIIGSKVNLITPDLAAWTRDGKDKPPGKGWEVVDGKLYRKSGAGDMISKRDYTNFILDFSWTIAKGGNSGIKYRLADYPKVEGVSLAGWLGLEYQVLDDFNTGEGKNPRVATASVYHVHKTNDSKSLKPHNEINHGRIIVCGNLLEHWLNGVCVSRIVVGSTEWKKDVAAGKFADVGAFGQNRSGRLLIQDHGNEVTFHTLTVRELTKSTAKR